jgi:hypothetical protein
MSLELPCSGCGRIRIYSTWDSKNRAIRNRTVCKICAGKILPTIQPVTNDPCERISGSGDRDDHPLAKFFDLLDRQRKKVPSGFRAGSLNRQSPSKSSPDRSVRSRKTSLSIPTDWLLVLIKVWPTIEVYYGGYVSNLPHLLQLPSCRGVLMGVAHLGLVAHLVIVGFTFP